MYRPPAGNIQEFLHILNYEIRNIKLHNPLSKIIVGGDFNIDFAVQNKNQNDVEEMLQLHDLVPRITMTTRLTDTSATIIDNIFTQVNYNTGTLLTSCSDHIATYVQLDIKKKI